MKDIEPSVKNGAADKYILEAGEKGSINTWIVCPSVIYGTHDAAGGVQGVGVSGIIYTAQSLGFVPYIGDGSSKFLAVSSFPFPCSPRLHEAKLTQTSGPYQRRHPLHNENHQMRSLRAAGERQCV